MKWSHTDTRSRQKAACTVALGSARGFSLVEMIATIAVLGIIAAIAIPSVGKVIEKSRSTVAGNVVDSLNKATREYSHSNGDLKYGPVTSPEVDALVVLRALQYRLSPIRRGSTN